MKVLIGGDICPINSNTHLFSESNSKIFGELQTIFEESDLNIVNLEAPLTASKEKIIKSGVNIKGCPSAALALKNARVDMVSLANNHIGDYGDKGVRDTIANCRAAGLDVIGAGANIQKAQQTAIVIKKGLKVGVLSFADNEFGMATENQAGANPFDLKVLTLQLLDIKKKVDYCIVLLHEGKEHYPYPSPDLQKICRYIGDIGADLIVCQHSHISGSWEKYKTTDIFYGQGNLLFDYASRRSPSWSEGFLIQIEIGKNKKHINLIPFKQSFPGIVALSEKEKKKFDLDMNIKSEKVLDPQFISNSWQDFIKKFRPTYISIFRGHGKFRRKIFSFFPFVKVFYNVKNRATLLNIIRSRVHREVIIDLLKNEYK